MLIHGAGNVQGLNAGAAAKTVRAAVWLDHASVRLDHASAPDPQLVIHVCISCSMCLITLLGCFAPCAVCMYGSLHVCTNTSTLQCALSVLVPDRSSTCFTFAACHHVYSQGATQGMIQIRARELPAHPLHLRMLQANRSHASTHTLS